MTHGHSLLLCTWLSLLHCGFQLLHCIHVNAHRSNAHEQTEREETCSPKKKKTMMMTMKQAIKCDLFDDMEDVKMGDVNGDFKLGRRCGCGC